MATVAELLMGCLCPGGNGLASGTRAGPGVEKPGRILMVGDD